MTCLLQVLLPESKANDSDAVHDADKHGGFEMGTWEWPNYVNLIARALGHKVDDSLLEKIPAGQYTCIVHRFTPEETKIIHDWLIANGKVEPLEKPYKKQTEHVVYPVKDYMDKKDVGMFCKWHDRLVEMFSNPADPVLWIQG